MKILGLHAPTCFPLRTIRLVAFLYKGIGFATIDSLVKGKSTGNGKYCGSQKASVVLNIADHDGARSSFAAEAFDAMICRVN